MFARRHPLFAAFFAGCATADNRAVDTSTFARRDAPLAPQASLPSRDSADSMIATYLADVVERDGAYPAELASMRAMSGPCIEEMYGDGSAAYWLARGRLLGYDKQVADTLYARLELLTVATQVPRSDSAYGSVVTAQIRTDTVSLRLVPDSSRSRWKICGYLSTGFEIGGYGRASNTRFRPESVDRADLLRQVDSIRNSPPRTE